MAMTEVSFTRNISPDVRRFQLATDSNSRAHQINIPPWCRRVTIIPEGKRVRLSFVTDSDDIHSDHVKLASNSPSEIEIIDGEGQGNRVEKMYIANLSVNTGTFVSVLVEGRTSK